VVANMGVFGKSSTTAAIWWRNKVDWTFISELRAKIVRGNIFLCIFGKFLCKCKKWRPRQTEAQKIPKLVVVALHIYTQAWTNCQNQTQHFVKFMTGYCPANKSDLVDLRPLYIPQYVKKDSDIEVGTTKTIYCMEI
jgi:hypothetical protein